MPISEFYQAAIRDLLGNEQNRSVLLQLAKTITNNICEIQTEDEALKYIARHATDIHTLLSKRAVTKEILFKYLHERTSTNLSGFTKAELIRDTIAYWDGQAPPQTVAVGGKLPIHQLASEFVQWFHDSYNKNSLKAADLWADASLDLQLRSSECVDELKCESATDVVANLMHAKAELSNIFFQPNLTDDGVQGRMDPHGLVVVLSCGTMHTPSNFVGVFESAFGLLRDPYLQANWKVKTIKSTWRLLSTTITDAPTLETSTSLVQELALPAPNGSL